MRLLADNGFGQEALALSRSLFTESLMLMEIADADGIRGVELVVGWSIGSIDDFNGLLSEAEKAGEDMSHNRELLASKRSWLVEYVQSNGARPRRWNVDEKALAVRPPLVSFSNHAGGQPCLTTPVDACAGRCGSR